MKPEEDFLACREMKPGAVLRGYTRRIHIYYYYKKYRGTGGKGGVRQADRVAEDIASVLKEKYAIILSAHDTQQVSGEILLHEWIYPIPLLGHTADVIDIDCHITEGGASKIADPRRLINALSRLVYRSMRRNSKK